MSQLKPHARTKFLVPILITILLIVMSLLLFYPVSPVGDVVEKLPTAFLTKEISTSL